MSTPKPKVTQFYKPTPRRREFTVLSALEPWYRHWDVGINGTRQCGGDLCQMCAMGYQKTVAYVCLAVDDNQDECWLELRERHRNAIDRGEAGNGCFAGAVVCVKREGEQKNSAVSVEVLTKVLVQQREIKCFVAKLGARPLLIARSSTSPLEREA